VRLQQRLSHRDLAEQNHRELAGTEVTRGKRNQNHTHPDAQRIRCQQSPERTNARTHAPQRHVV
jgi:hypothetical protein